MSTVRTLISQGIPCEINYTITRTNFKEIIDVAEYIKVANIDCLINIGMVKIAGRANDRDSTYYFTKDEIEDCILSIKRQIKETKKIKSFYLLEPIYYRLFGNKFGCPAARLTATIKSNGDVFSCRLLSEDLSYLCGNIKHKSFYDIWTGSEMQRIRTLPVRDDCVKCSFYCAGCTGACRGNALNYCGKICGEDINCDFYKVDFNEMRNYNE